MQNIHNSVQPQFTLFMQCICYFLLVIIIKSERHNNVKRDFKVVQLSKPSFSGPALMRLLEHKLRKLKTNVKKQDKQ